MIITRMEREAWADQEWRLICSRRVSKDLVKLYINGCHIGTVTVPSTAGGDGKSAQDYPDVIGQVGRSDVLGEMEIADFRFVEGDVTDSEFAYYTEILMSKYNINKYSDQENFSQDQEKAKVIWDPDITAENNRFRGDTYETSGNYLELVS